MCLGSWLLFLVVVSPHINSVNGNFGEEIQSKVARDDQEYPRCCPKGKFGFPNCSLTGSDPDQDLFKPRKTYESNFDCSGVSEFDENNAKYEENGDLLVDGIRIVKKNYCLDFAVNKKFSGFYCNAIEEQKCEPVPLVQQASSIISIILLLVTAGVYFLCPMLRKSSQSPYIVSLATSLAMALISLVGIQLFPAIRPWKCKMLGYSMQYFFLSAFFWMNAKCINLYIKLSKLRPTTGRCIEEQNIKEFRRSCIYAWGVPLLISITTICCQHLDSLGSWKPDIGRGTCFFENWSVKWVYFYGPMAAIIVANIILFTLTASVILKNQSSSIVVIANRNKRQIDIWYFYQYLKLFLVTGLSWVVEVLEFAKNPENLAESNWKYVWVVLDTFNCLQGAFIFIFFVCQRGTIKRIFLRDKNCRMSYVATFRNTTVRKP